jgi:hypothetical protein
LKPICVQPHVIITITFRFLLRTPFFPVLVLDTRAQAGVDTSIISLYWCKIEVGCLAASLIFLAESL